MCLLTIMTQERMASLHRMLAAWDGYISIALLVDSYVDAHKEGIVNEVRACVDKFSTVYVVGVANMRNVAVQRVRSQLSSSRLFFGRTKLLSAALGRHRVHRAAHGAR